MIRNETIVRRIADLQRFAAQVPFVVSAGEIDFIPHVHARVLGQPRGETMLHDRLDVHRGYPIAVVQETCQRFNVFRVDRVMKEERRGDDSVLRLALRLLWWVSIEDGRGQFASSNDFVLLAFGVLEQQTDESLLGHVEQVGHVLRVRVGHPTNGDEVQLCTDDAIGDAAEQVERIEAEFDETLEECLVRCDDVSSGQCTGGDRREMLGHANGRAVGVRVS